jgi:hypothetical protein
MMAMDDASFFAFNFTTEEIETTDQEISSKIISSSESFQNDKNEARKEITNEINVDKPDREQTARLNIVPIRKYTSSTNCEGEISDVCCSFDVIPIGNTEIITAQVKGESVSPPNILRRVRLLNRLETLAVAGNNSIEKSDLIPGIYEGGLKVWECSIDLCRYLYELHSTTRLENSSSSSDLSWALNSDGTTLELGCGHGLPGILVSLLGASNRNKVLFSDFNDYVLEYCTLRNLFLNTPDPYHSSLQSRIALVSGDWFQLSSHLMAENGSNKNREFQQVSKIFSSRSGISRFDLILAAETTYTESSSRDTATLLSRHLKFDSGVGLVATKRYYFGVRGGTDCFRRFAENIRVERLEEVEGNQPITNVYTLRVQTVKVIDDGNIREILKIKLQKMVNE